MQMHRLALVRGINTAEDEHGRGAYIMQTGRRQTPGERYPHLGSVMAKLLGNEDSPLPGYVHISPRGDVGGFNRNDCRLPRPALRLGHARRRRAARQPAAACRR